MGTIRFDLRKDMVSKKTLKSPVRIIYQIKGDRVSLQTDIKLHPLNWSEKRIPVFINKKHLNNEIKILEEEIKRIESSGDGRSDIALKKLKLQRNEYSNLDFDITLLDSIQVEKIKEEMEYLKSEIRNIEKRFEYTKQSYSVVKILEEFKQLKDGITHKDESKEMLFEFMDQYIADHISIREPGSLSVYKSVKNHLKSYEIHTRTKVRFETIDYNFFAKFQTFLINLKKTDKQGNEHHVLNNSTIAKALSTLKTFLNYAKRSGIKVQDGYRDFAIKKEKLEVIALDQDEFDALLNLDLSNNKRLDQTRDCFIFGCVTGMRYADVAQLRREHINNGTITLTIKKTKTELTIPLNAISAKILHKYNDHSKPLPIISNQKINDNLKILCKLADIDDPIEIVRFRGSKREVNVYPKWMLISFHNSRKTFASLSLERGMSTEEVMKLGGWESYNSFKRYSKVTEKRKVVVMHAAWGDSNINNLKIV